MGLSPGEPPADRNCMNEPGKTGPNYRVMSKPMLPVTRFGAACSLATGNQYTDC